MKLCIPSEIWQQMRGYCLASTPNEVTGIGTIKSIHNDLFVDRIFIPRQLVSPGYCKSAKGAINEIIFNVAEDNPARAGELRFRWHSHAEGSVFWSATDEEDIEAWQGPWVVNLVMNVYHDYLARLDLFQGLRIKNIPLDVKIITPLSNAIMAQCRQEIAMKAKPIPWAPTSLADLKPDTIAAFAAQTESTLEGGDICETK